MIILTEDVIFLPTNRLACDSAALKEWMDRARELIGGWSQLTVLANQETDLNDSGDHYQQFVVCL